MEGYGWKKGEKGLGGFKRRYFRLDPGSYEIEYSEQPSDTKSRGRIELFSLKRIFPIVPADLGTSKTAKAYGEYGLSLMTDKRTYHVLFETASERDGWVRAMWAAVDPAACRLHPSLSAVAGVGAAAAAPAVAVSAAGRAALSSPEPAYVPPVAAPAPAPSPIMLGAPSHARMESDPAPVHVAGPVAVPPRTSTTPRAMPINFDDGDDDAILTGGGRNGSATNSGGEDDKKGSTWTSMFSFGGKPRPAAEDETGAGEDTFTPPAVNPFTGGGGGANRGGSFEMSSRGGRGGGGPPRGRGGRGGPPPPGMRGRGAPPPGMMRGRGGPPRGRGGRGRGRGGGSGLAAPLLDDSSDDSDDDSDDDSSGGSSDDEDAKKKSSCCVVM